MFEILQGDCLDVLKHIMPNEFNSVLVTDPPFNIGYKYKTYHDKLDHDEYYNMLYSVSRYFDKRVLIAYPEILYEFAALYGCIPTRVVSWVYNSNTPRQHRDIAFYGVSPDFKKRGQPYKNPNDKRIKERIARGEHARLYDWWNVNQVKNTNKDKTKHPCQMPVEIMLNVIGCLPDGVTVIDPFCGSGTTGVACKLLNVPFIGIDIDDEYCDIAKKRINNA